MDKKLQLQSLRSQACFPVEIERRVFLEAMGSDSVNGHGGSPARAPDWRLLLVAKRVLYWLKPVLYRTVDIDCQKKAERFASSLQHQEDFARTFVCVLRLRSTVSPKRGAEILQLCQGLQELTMEIAVDLPDDRNPLRGPFSTLNLTSLSMDLSSGFYGPFIVLSELNVLRHIRRLHLTNGWVARRGHHLGLRELDKLTHLSFPVYPLTGQRDVYSETFRHILKTVLGLQVMVLWARTYDENTGNDLLEDLGLSDDRIVIFDAN